MSSAENKQMSLSEMCKDKVLFHLTEEYSLQKCLWITSKKN